jgi:hypothetical protein
VSLTPTAESESVDQEAEDAVVAGSVEQIWSKARISEDFVNGRDSQMKLFRQR